MNDGITWVGLDAHKKAINVAVRLPHQREFLEWTVANEPRALRRLARRLVREAKSGEVRCCYEAGVCGYSVQRQLEASAPIVCEVVAPSLIPRKPGDQVKTDRRDARKLCELFAAGLLTEVKPPSKHDEAVRDLYRCRDDLRDDLMRARHRLGKFILRRGIRYTEGKRNWTRMHHRWLQALRFDDAVDQIIFDEYYLAVVQREERLATMDQRLAETADEEPYRAAVSSLRCFRGIDTVTAFGLVAELYEIRRFDSPRQLASFVGMTPREHSSGDKAKRGRITRTGNSYVRRLVIEAALHHRHRPGVGEDLRKRREGQPAQVIAIADKAQQRLYRRYHRLVARGVQHNKALVAVARELLGFVWSTLHQVHRKEVAA